MRFAYWDDDIRIFSLTEWGGARYKLFYRPANPYLFSGVTIVSRRGPTATSQHDVIGLAPIERAFCICTQVANGAFVLLGFAYLGGEQGGGIMRVTPRVSWRSTLLRSWRPTGSNLAALPEMGSSWSKGNVAVT